MIKRRIKNLFVNELGMDLGTVNTLIYCGDRIILNTPSTIATNKYTGRTVALGHAAEQMFEQEPYGVAVHHPMKDGTIADFDLAGKMIQGFLRQVGLPRWKYTRVLLAVSASATDIERDALSGAARQAGANTVELVDAGLAAAIGSRAITEDTTKMVVDIGGGTTNFSVTATYGVIFSWSLKVAGTEMSEAISEHIRQKEHILIGYQTAEYIKAQLGSAIEPKKSRTLPVLGKSAVDGTPRTVELSARDVAQALDKPIQAILSGVNFVFKHVPPEVARRVQQDGIVLTGGGSLIRNLGKRFIRELRMPVQRAACPLEAVALGAGQLVTNAQLINKFNVLEEMPDWHAEKKVYSLAS